MTSKDYYFDSYAHFGIHEVCVLKRLSFLFWFLCTGFWSELENQIPMSSWNPFDLTALVGHWTLVKPVMSFLPVGDFGWLNIRQHTFQQIPCCGQKKKYFKKTLKYLFWNIYLKISSVTVLMHLCNSPSLRGLCCFAVHAVSIGVCSILYSWGEWRRISSRPPFWFVSEWNTDPPITVCRAWQRSDRGNNAPTAAGPELSCNGVTADERRGGGIAGGGVSRGPRTLRLLSCRPDDDRCNDERRLACRILLLIVINGRRSHKDLCCSVPKNFSLQPYEQGCGVDQISATPTPTPAWKKSTPSPAPTPTPTPAHASLFFSHVEGQCLKHWYLLCNAFDAKKNVGKPDNKVQ